MNHLQYLLPYHNIKVHEIIFWCEKISWVGTRCLPPLGRSKTGQLACVGRWPTYSLRLCNALETQRLSLFQWSTCCPLFRSSEWRTGLRFSPAWENSSSQWYSAPSCTLMIECFVNTGHHSSGNLWWSLDFLRMEYCTCQGYFPKSTWPVRQGTHT